MRHFFESYNLHGSCRLVSVGLITLFITSVNTTNILTDTNPEYWQYWKVEGYQERFYISFEYKIIQEKPQFRIPILNRMSYFTGQTIKYPDTLEDKVKLFRYQFQPQENVDPAIIHVSKTNILNDSYEFFRHPESTETLKALKTIVVTDEATGIVDEYTFKEWFLELIARMLHPDHEFFSYSKRYHTTLLINEKSPFLKYYEFFGKLFGAAVYQNLFVNAHLSDRFYKMMLGRDIELDDIKEVNYEAYSQLKFDRPKLTKSTKQIKSIVQRDYVEPVRPIMSAIANGFDQLVPVRFLKIFNVMELQLVLEGDTDIKPQDHFTWLERKLEWKQNTIGFDNERMDSVIDSFWQTLDKFLNIEIRKLLQFVTGMSKLPVGGFTRLTPKFKIERDNSKFRVPPPPKASIRFNTITLYDCERENMRKLVVEAIKNVDQDKSISNQERYGFLPEGWQRWKWEKSSNEEIYIYLNTDSGATQQKDPRLGTLTEPLYLKEKEMYTRSLEQKIHLFRYQLRIVYNTIAHPEVRCMEETYRANIIEKSYEYIMNVKLIDLLHLSFLDYIRVIRDNYRRTIHVREWLSALFLEVFDPNNKFFKYVDSEDHQLQINPHFQDLNYFKFVGRLLGMSIIHDVAIAAYFTKPFYRLLLGERTSLEDIKDFDLHYYNTLLNRKKSDQSFESDDGTSRQNIDEVIDESIREKYVKPILPQMSAILSGLDDFAHPHLFKIFNVDELKEYLGGTPTIDVQDWRGNTEYNGFDKNSETVKFFWEIVEKLKHDAMERLLRFATGRVRIRPPGFKDLSPLFQIQLGDEKEKRGIVFEAKFNRITLPKYSNRNDLENDLRAAVAAPLPFDEH